MRKHKRNDFQSISINDQYFILRIGKHRIAKFKCASRKEAMRFTDAAMEICGTCTRYLRRCRSCVKYRQYRGTKEVQVKPFRILL